MVGAKSRQGPRQVERILVDKYPESFTAELTEKGVYTQITDTTTGRSVAVPTAHVQIVQTVLEAFLPKGGAAKGVEPEVVAQAPVAPAEPAAAKAPKQTKVQTAAAAKNAEAQGSTKPASKAPASKKPAKPDAERPAPKTTSKDTTPAAAAAVEPWFEALPASINVTKRMKLTKTIVAVDEKKKDRVIGQAGDNPGLPAVPAYSIEVSGVKGANGPLNVGYVLAVSETKFLIVAPQLGPKTSHRGITPTAQRLEILLETSSDQALLAA